jgi:Uri superfamily endonuclease
VKGVYATVFKLREPKSIEIGALGELRFETGKYVYVGSAMNNVEKRIERHFSTDKKKHWHIDYFSVEAERAGYMIYSRDSEFECVLAGMMAEIGEPVDGFGSSDCSCNSHLFRLEV